MGMISDCYQLQENQRKNDPLTVETPPPPAGADRLPCWPAVRRTYPRRSLAPFAQRLPFHLSPALAPAPATIPRRPCEVQQGKKPRKPLRRKASWRMPKRYRNQHSRRRRLGECGRDMSEIMRRPCGRFPWSKSCRGFSWRFASSCPPDLLRPCTQTRSMPACQAGRRVKTAFPIRYRKRMSRNNT